MSFDLASFEAKMQALLGVLPSVGQLVQVAETLAPKAAGLTKAGLVINTVVAMEPTLTGLESVVATAVTGIVNAYRSAGTLPAAGATPAPAPAPSPVAASATAQAESAQPSTGN